MFESRSTQSRTILFDQDGTGNAADISGQAPCNSLRQFVFEGNIAYCESATRFQDAGDLAEDGWLVGSEIENAV